MLLKRHGTKMESRESLSRLASFTCDFEDEPLSEQDLLAIQAIEARFQSSLPTKRPPNPTQDHCTTGTSTPAIDSSHRIRRRLPKSLIAFNIHFLFLCHLVKGLILGFSNKGPSLSSSAASALIIANIHSEETLQDKTGKLGSSTLTDQQLDYAATDAYASWYLYQVIRELPDPSGNSRIPK